jgi:hypothetical protein
MSIAKIGTTRSQTRKEKIRKTLTGMKRSQATKDKVSKARNEFEARKRKKADGS